MGAIRQGGLFSVDVDIVPTKIGECAHVMLPAATSGEMNLTSMNGERRMRLTERYMDPPGNAKPDCLIAAGLAQALERSWRAAGKNDVADKFKGYDWKTEEDAFMDGYHQHANGGKFVTYDRLRAMGTNGFQEPAVDYQPGPQDKVVAERCPNRPRTARSSEPSVSTPMASFHRRTARPHFMATQVARAAGRGQGSREGQVPVPDQQRASEPRMAIGLPRPEQRLRHGSLSASLSFR